MAERKDISSKYANLPGIASDQQDVYETSDLPEVDQRRPASLIEGDQSDNVEVLNVAPADAFRKFNDSDQTGVYKLLQPPNRTSFQSWGEWEIGQQRSANGEAETPLQRYHRLQTELQDLLSTLTEVKEKSKQSVAGGKGPDSFSGDLSYASAADNLERLARQVKDLNIEQWVENDILKGSKPNIEALSSLETQLKAAKAKQSDSNKQKPGSGQQQATITYELVCGADQSRLEDLAKINALEQKIKRLETLIGHDDEKLSFLTNMTNNKTLTEAVKLLSAKVSQLDAPHLEQIDGRLTSILQKLNQISKAKPEDGGERQQSSVNVAQLHELLLKSDEQRTQLPIIAARLNTLADVQEQAAQFAAALSYMDTLQTQIGESLANNDADLKLMKETFEKNMATLRQTLEQFDKRIQALK